MSLEEMEKTTLEVFERNRRSYEITKTARSGKW